MRRHLVDYAEADGVPPPPEPKPRGYGFEAILVLEQARTIAGTAKFCGSSAEALRQAGRERDADITRAVTLLKLVRPPERIIKRIVDVQEHERESFRRRMVADFDQAVARLINAAKPTARQEVARAAARDAANWTPEVVRSHDARQLALDEQAVWERVFREAMEEHDRDGRARRVAGSVFVEAPRPGKRGLS